MSKPDPASGSLESILASIRKSLAEQSGDGQAESRGQAAGAEAEAKPARRNGLSQRLAGTPPEHASQDLQDAHGTDDLSDLLENPSAPAPSPVASGRDEAQEAAPSEDPLWFLTRREEAAAAPAPEPVPTPRAPAPAPEPKLTRPEVLRASMPPFFGSSSDDSSATPEIKVQPPLASPAPEAVAPAAPPSNASMAHEVSLVAAAVESAASRPAAPMPTPTAGVSALNGRAQPSPPPAAAPQPAEVPGSRALEAAVLELLKPMLRQWLDENMPRLVADALGDQGPRDRVPEGGSKKM